jgi:hypothetical protein
MLRALSLAILVISAAPAVAAELPKASVVAQQQQTPPQAAPKRDCERRQEGIS